MLSYDSFETMWEGWHLQSMEPGLQGQLWTLCIIGTLKIRIFDCTTLKSQRVSPLSPPTLKKSLT